MESRKRSIVKALSWRFFATAITVLVVFLLSGEVIFAAKIGLLDTTIKLAAYFVHERLWLRIAYGRYHHTDYQI
jgi:adenylylsulfate kinase